jgi:solute carrier family 25 (mitochondrial folate transporter), member 32
MNNGTGSIASTTTYPFQVIKSRLQQRSGDSLELTSSGNVKVVRKEYIGFMNTVQRIWVKEGVSGFFKGCITNAVRVAPGAAITFLVYESVLDAYEYNNN